MAEYYEAIKDDLQFDLMCQAELQDFDRMRGTGCKLIVQSFRFTPPASNLDLTAADHAGASLW